MILCCALAMVTTASGNLFSMLAQCTMVMPPRHVRTSYICTKIRHHVEYHKCGNIEQETTLWPGPTESNPRVELRMKGVGNSVPDCHEDSRALASHLRCMVYVWHGTVVICMQTYLPAMSATNPTCADEKRIAYPSSHHLQLQHRFASI